MDYAKLIDLLTQVESKLRSEQIAEIDFSELAELLNLSVSAIGELSRQAALSSQLVGQFQNELAAKAHAVARLKGTSGDLIEKLIYREGVTFEELLQLRTDIEKEFDLCFSRTLKEPTGAAKVGEKAVEFKI